MKTIDKMYNTQKVAEILDVTPQTVRAWCRNGKIKHIVLPGKQIRIHESTVREILSQGW